MATTSPTSNLTSDSASAQLDSSIPVILASADSDAVDAIQNLGLIKQARVSQLTRVAVNATAQYGSGSPQVVAAQSAVTATTSAVTSISLLNQQATTPSPAVAANGWALHGRVYDSNQKPLSGHTVFLVDIEKNYLNAYGFAYTDATGYFLINYPGTAPAGAATQTEAPASPAAQATELFLQIADTNANPVYLSTTAFQPIVGAATYQVVNLASGEPALGDPPTSIRKVALPPAKK
jgi:hypothetical protein